MARRPRCVYREGPKQCPRNGTGNPILCKPHRQLMMSEMRTERSPLADLFRKFATGKPVSRDDLFNAGEQIFGKKLDPSMFDFDGMSGAEVQEKVAETIRQQAKARGAKAPPRPPPRKITAKEQEILKAKRVLGFDGVLLLLNADIIKARHRELAKKFHPDRPGGSTAKMQEVNAAVDVLMASVA